MCVYVRACVCVCMCVCVYVRVCVWESVFMCQFWGKKTALTFPTQVFPKMDLGLEIQKTNLGIRISILNIPCVPILSQNG